MGIQAVFRSIAGIAGASLIALSIGGCAAGNHPEATHHWVSSSAASENQYRADNASCMMEAFGTTGQRVFDTSAPEYWQYSACMNRRGYALTANDVAASR